MSNLEIILSAIGLISTIGIIIIFVPILTEREESAKQNLQEATDNLDKIVEKAILHCYGDDPVACDEIMLGWSEKCKEEIMKDIPSCHDGRFENYLKNNSLDSPNSESISTKSNTFCNNLQTRQNEKIVRYGYESDELNYFREINSDSLISCGMK